MRTGESSDIRKQAGKADALYSGASSAVMNPGDIQGNKGFERAGKAWKDKKYGTALHEFTNAGLSIPTKYLMQPLRNPPKLATFELMKKQGATDLEAAYQTGSSAARPIGPRAGMPIRSSARRWCSVARPSSAWKPG
jgi:predicted secreted hydrolase